MDRDPKSFPDDSRRPLTLKGEERVKVAAAAMQVMELGVDLILSSPYQRARQTADIVATELGLRRSLDFRDELAPAGDLKALIQHINGRQPPPENVLLVGHEPDLSQFLSVLIFGANSGAIDFKKNGLARVEVEDTLKLGQCATLNWLLTPRQLGLLT